MTDLSMDAPLQVHGEAKLEEFFIDTTAAATIYKGQPLLIIALGDTTNVVGYVDATNVAAADVCVGIAAEQKTVVAADPETTRIKAYTWPTILGFKSTVLTNEDLGKTVYMSDSAVLSLTAGDNPQIGTVFKVEGDYVFIKLSTPQVCSGAGG
jgi:hypothetical protein